MNPTNAAHIDELAELYALGALDDSERNAVDAHASTCAECSARLSEAEQTIFALTDTSQVPSPQLGRRIRAAANRPNRAWPIAAVIAAAAAIALIILPLTRTPTPSPDAAILAMVNGHFAHAPFIALQPDAPRAKAIFARNHAWIYVIAQTSKPLTVAIRTKGIEEKIGQLHVSNNTAWLFVQTKTPNRISLVLLDGNRPLAHVTL